MTVRSMLPILFAAALLAGCQPAPEGAADMRLISVSGEGELKVTPEIAIVQLAIQARGRELAMAQDEAGKVVAAVLELTSALGIAPENVQSSQLRVQPEFDWHDGRQSLRGYLVHRDIRVELAELDKLGALMERAMRAGVNQVSAPELRVRDPRQLHRQVLALAAEDAHANAETLAQTLGVSLGRVHRILAADQEDVAFRPMELGLMRAADAVQVEQSYQSGQITVRSRLRAEFALR